MKKRIALLLVAVMVVLAAMSVNAAEFKPEVYSSQRAYIEEGYEGDVWNGVCEILILNEDGTYIRIENTEIIHYGGNVVTYWTYTATGKYEVVDDDGEVKTVSLAAPDDVFYVMNDAATTVDDDESLLEYFEEEEIELDLETLKF